MEMKNQNLQNTWQQDKRWSDKFIPEIKQILGLYLIDEPAIEEDQERNTDLVVLRLEAVRVGCRVRRNGYAEKYGDEFTIRAGRPSGIKTELTKIVEGWGDYFFYGFSTKDETKLEKWLLGDLKCFRLWFNRFLMKHEGHMPGIRKQNRDNSSSLVAFNVKQLPNDFIVAKSNGDIS